MKKLNYIIFVMMAGIFFSCIDEIDTERLTDFSPGIASVTPADGGKVVKGNFDIEVAFADGTSSPLKHVDITLMDGEENELYSASKDLSGTRDTLVVNGSDFNASALEVGSYKLNIMVVDSKDQVTDVTTTFEISKLPYAANNDEMYIAGAFNGWTWDSLILVADNIWEIKNIEMDGGQWKFKNTKDWTDQDWGDPECDGIVQITTGGGPNTECGQTGLMNITFNDKTLQYTVEPAVTLEGNLEALYLLGTFNNFQGSEYEFTQTADNTWTLDEVVLRPGDSFKFSEGPYSGKSFGDIEPDGVADESAPNVTFDGAEGVYSVKFNDKTLEYNIEFVRNLFPDNLYLVGDATAANWDPAAALEFSKIEEGKFEIFADLSVGEFKFLEVRDWAGDWGEGSASGTIVQEGESNIAVSEAGLYRIFVDFTTYTYSITPLPSELFLVGGSTVAGWDPSASVKFVKLGSGVFRIYSYLTVADGFKFLQEQDWAGDWGKSTDGNLVQEGESNITVPADGFYRIDVDYNTRTYSVTESNWGIIGDATPNGWDSDTDMALASETMGNYTWTIDVTLTDGELKFRENDLWDINYGDFGADGSLENGGDNIAVSAGTYTIQLILDPINGFTYTIE